MSELFYAVAVLACPVGMGAMMFFMMRGNKHPAGDSSGNARGDEMTRLRAEVDQLRAAQRDETAAGGTSATEPQVPR